MDTYRGGGGEGGQTTQKQGGGISENRSVLRGGGSPGGVPGGVPGGSRGGAGGRAGGWGGGYCVRLRSMHESPSLSSSNIPSLITC